MPDLLPCVPSNEAVLSFGYHVEGADTASLSFGYQVGQSSEEYASLTFGYETTIEGITSWEPTETPWGHMTQYMGNYFPYWHAANYKVGGRTQRVLNSLQGFHLTKLMSSIRRLRANLFLSTADVSEPYKVWTCSRPVAFSEQADNYNLLLNPSFSTIYPQRLGPWGWSSALPSATGSWSITRGLGLFGYNAVRLVSQAGESVSLSQDRDLIFRPGSSYTATVWYAGMRPSRAADYVPMSGARLQISTQYSDGTIEVSSIFLKDATDGAWTRASLTFTPVKDTHNIQVSIVVSDNNGETVDIEVGGVQLEVGDRSSPFSEHRMNTNSLSLVYPVQSVTEATSWGSITYDRQPRVIFKDSYGYEAYKASLPDRATVSDADGEQSVSKNLFDAVIESGGQYFTVGWRISNNLIERYNADIRQEEIWGYYKVADLYGDGSTDLEFFRPADFGVTSTYEALTIAGEWIYVVVKEVYLGKTQRVLKICSPYIRWDDTNHLESYADIYLDDGDGSCTYLGLVDGRTDKLLMTIDGNDKIVDLIWDSAARDSNGMIIFRNDVSDAVVVV